MTIDIDLFLKTVAAAIRDKQVPVVDLIAVQTKDPFKVLVATILSARTKDETTAKASARLFKYAPNADSLANCLKKKSLPLFIRSVFTKPKPNISAMLPERLKQFGGKVPDTIEELITLPGVGRKTANLVVSVAFPKTSYLC